MKKFTTFESRLVPFPIDNVDTDQIIPARFLKTISKEGLDRQLFNDWRYDAAGDPNPDFILNQPRGRGAEILLAGDNFGCGSSREHAPWALTQFGFRAVISTSFADIFKGNSLKNGLLPIVVSQAIQQALFNSVEADTNYRVTVSLADQVLILGNGEHVAFPVDEFSKSCLLEGVDELGYIIGQESEITAFEQSHPAPVNTLAALQL
ncbi:MAG: 3-isopropylmalate dehydratase small subunit [Bryobacteraceae bacterium]|nr:3-isopropylmalate dehydratase small subunit [Bryobacteraceae bacterium]